MKKWCKTTKKEDLPNFSDSNKRVWKNDKEFQIRYFIDFLIKNIKIIEIDNKVRHLQSDFNSLKNQLEKLKNDGLNLSCSNAGSFLS
nr:hypothetical protein [Spiroplasma sp. Moj]